MFSNGINVQTNTGNLFVDAQAAYHQERLLEAARDARQARQATRPQPARDTRSHGPHGLDRLRHALRRADAAAPAAR